MGGDAKTKLQAGISGLFQSAPSVDDLQADTSNEQVSSKFEELNQSGQVSSTSEEPNQSEQVSSSEDQNQLGQMDSSNEQFKRTVQTDSRTVQMDSSNGQLDSSNELFDRTDGQFNRADQPDSSNEIFSESNKPNKDDSFIETISSSTDDEKNRLTTSFILRTKNQKKLAAYLKNLGSHITTYQIIKADTGIPYGSLRRLIKTFSDAGFITVEKYYGERNIQGMRVTVIAIPGVEEEQVVTNRTVQMDTSNEQFNRTVHSPLLDSKIDNNTNLTIYEEEQGSQPSDFKSKLLALTKEDYSIFWPNLTAIGWTTSQTQQCITQLEKLDLPIENLRDAFTHADAALEMNAVISKQTGEIPESPLNYIFSAIRRSGYYTPPPGYKSPEVLRLEDEAKQIQAQVEAQKRIETLKKTNEALLFKKEYTLWREELSEEELDKLKSQAPSHAQINEKHFESWMQTVWYPQVKGVAG